MAYPTKKGSDGASTGNEEVKAVVEVSTSEQGTDKIVSDAQVQASSPSGKSDLDPK